MRAPTVGALIACFRDDEAAECLQGWCDAVAEGEEEPTTIRLDLPHHPNVLFHIREDGTFVRDDRTLSPSTIRHRRDDTGRWDGYEAYSRRTY